VDASKTISGAHFDGCSSEPWCNVFDTGGYGLFFKPFQGNQPAGDLLPVHFYQDNPASSGTKYTLSGYTAGEANFCGFFATNNPVPRTLFVIQFLDASSVVLASNAFDLVSAGLPSSGPGSMSSFRYTTPQVTAPAGTATVRAGASLLNAYSTSGAQSFFLWTLLIFNPRRLRVRRSSPTSRATKQFRQAPMSPSLSASPTRPGLPINGNSTEPTSPTEAVFPARPRRH
jgi:hypothetical protein